MPALVLPRMLADALRPDDPFIFLVGPIKGGADWQRTACEMIWDLLPEAVIAVPCKWSTDHPLYRYRMPGPDDAFSSQTFWERFYLEYAAMGAKRGCIVGWLSCESKEQPRDDGQPYARDTYGEVGEWRGRLMGNGNLRFVLGAEPLFPGLGVMKKNFAGALDNFKIHETLGDTINAALKMMRLWPDE